MSHKANTFTGGINKALLGAYRPKVHRSSRPSVTLARTRPALLTRGVASTERFLRPNYTGDVPRPGSSETRLTIP